MTATETRFIRANVRQENAQGSFRDKVFEVTVPVTGSFSIMSEHAIAEIRKQGYETQYIIDHSSKRDCV